MKDEKFFRQYLVDQTITGTSTKGDSPFLEMEMSLFVLRRDRIDGIDGLQAFFERLRVVRP